jgi:hypothetical protein
MALIVYQKSYVIQDPSFNHIFKDLAPYKGALISDSRDHH